MEHRRNVATSIIFSLFIFHQDENLFIEKPDNSKDLAPLPDESLKSTRSIVEVPLDPQIAFAFMVRYCRIKHGLTQQEAARKMGFDTLYSYQRLEARRSILA